MALFDNGTGNLGIGDAISSLSNSALAAFGLSSGSAKNSASPNPYPWSAENAIPGAGNIPGQVSSAIASPFFPYIDILPNRWNQLFPYRLLVIDVTKQNKLVGTSNINSALKVVQGQQQGSTTLIFEPLGYNWAFNLPITPQQLNITDQFAINTSATLRGILEEHNGVKFKIINASGTMGVWPYRESVTKPPGSPSIIQSVFGGTLSAATGFINQVATTVRTFTTNSPNAKPTTISPTTPGSTFGSTSTGYYQALYLQQFLEQYAEAKRDPDNAGWRLVFDIPKQNQSYIVTPMAFTWQQSVTKPIEIMYQLQFKAWRRVDLNEVPQNVSPASAYTITPGILQKILNSITEARLTCSSAIALIGAVTSDVNGVFAVLSQTALFVKDLLGVATTASDFPQTIVKDWNSATQQYVFSNSMAIAGAVTTTAGATAVKTITAVARGNNGLSPTAVSNGQLGQTAANAQQVNNATAILNNPNANVDLLDQVPTNQLSLNNAQQAKLNNILSNTTLTVAQLKQNQSTILNLAVQLADYFGAGDTTYNTLYNLTPPASRLQPMQIPEFDILETLYEFVNGINYLTATTQVTDLNLISSFEYVAGLASASGITVNIPNSKIYTPVPYNATIEQIAGRYLGDPTRWIEIATLNNLEEPYIDQNGFQLPLFSNAIGRQVVVSTDQNLFIGQVVTLMSATQVPTSRQITNITTLPNGNSYLLTLNGEPNLGNFLIADQAYVQAYLPNTVNSQQKIFIPSDLPEPTYPGQANIIPPGLAQSDPLTGLSGVDLLLTGTGDLAFNQYGDFMIAYGLTNLVQALWILFNTVLNSSLLDPNYGVSVNPGTSIADLNIQQLYQQINQQVSQDPRFAAVTSLQITATPPSLIINLAVALPGNNGTLPLTFELAA